MKVNGVHEIDTQKQKSRNLKGVNLSCFTKQKNSFTFSPPFSKYSLVTHIPSIARSIQDYIYITLKIQSQVGNSLIRQEASPLSPKVNYMHRDITRQCIGRGLSIKKAEWYYLQFVRKQQNLESSNTQKKLSYLPIFILSCC